MCGIAGILDFSGGRITPDRLKAMTDALAHRGPDGEGQWLSPDGHIGLGHRRLAVIDLRPTAAQPMHYGERYVACFNGEIYNYVELRELLENEGWRFRTHSDTEVALAAFAAYGVSCLDRFDGMFAIAIWDRKMRRLFLARDRLGEKPLYYHHRAGRELVFASEMKALFTGGVPLVRDSGMLYRYLAHGVVLDPSAPEATFYSSVVSLGPGEWMAVDSSTTLPQSKRYWSVSKDPEQADPPAFSEAAEQFLSLLTDSVRRRLRADVPIGSSLSGGLDSSSVVALVSRLLGHAGRAKAFSARFDDEALDEGPYMRLVSQHCNVDLFETWPDSRGLARSLEAVFRHQEEPFGSASIFAQWEVMRLAQDNSTTVLLDGQGADEILGGYLHFFGPYLRELYLREPEVFCGEKSAFERRHGTRVEPGWRFSLEARAPWLLRGLGWVRRQLGVNREAKWLAKDFVRAHARSPPPFRSFRDLNAALAFFTQGYGLTSLLRYADRNSMAFGREIRLPFLSPDLVEFVFTLPAGYKLREGWTKRLLREAMTGLLPERIRLRVDKLGFQPPADAWLGSPEIVALTKESASILVRERVLSSEDFPPEFAWRVLMGGLFLSRSVA